MVNTIKLTEEHNRRAQRNLLSLTPEAAALLTKNCESCGKPFQIVHPTQVVTKRFCSGYCSAHKKS